jgi:hypothetical protein
MRTTIIQTCHRDVGAPKNEQIRINERKINTAYLFFVGERRGVYRVVVWKPGGKRPLRGGIILRWIFR